MKRLIIISLLIVVSGCATSAEYNAANLQFRQNNYIKALEYYERALSKAVTQSQRDVILRAIHKTKNMIEDKVLSEAYKAYHQSSPPTIKSINSAISILSDSLHYNLSHRISDKIAEYNQEKRRLLSSVNALEKKADKLLSKGEYLKALNVLKKAIQMDESNRRLLAKISKLNKNIEELKERYLQQIDKLLINENGEEADVVYNKLVQIAPESPNLKILQLKIKKAKIKQLLVKLSVWKSQNRYFTAYQALTNSDCGKLNDEIIKIRSLGSRYYYDKAKTQFNSGNNYLAYINLIKAKKLAPNDIRIFQLYRDVEDIVNQKIQKYIAIATFNAPVNNPDIGKLLSDALISRLFKSLPYGISIVERERIDLLIMERRRKLEDIGNLLGVQMIVTGNVSLFKVDKSSSKRTVIAKVKLGQEKIQNSEFLRMIKIYGKNTKKWPYVPPMTQTRDKFKFVHYKKGKVTLKAFGNVSVRIFDTNKAAIVYAEDFKDSVEKSDTFQEPVEGTNIIDDPLELPTETEIEEELLNKLIDKIATIIGKIFEDREKRFLEWATFYVKRKEYSEALKSLAQGYLYCKKAKKNNKTSKKIYDLMIDLTETKLNVS